MSLLQMPRVSGCNGALHNIALVHCIGYLATFFFYSNTCDWDSYFNLQCGFTIESSSGASVSMAANNKDTRDHWFAALQGMPYP